MIIRLRSGDESAPLFLFPGAGGDARELSPLASFIRSPRTVLGVELLAFSTRDHEPLTVPSIADACFREIRMVQPQGPYYLAGYSFGGLVAIEVARLLRNAGQNIGLLVLIDTMFDHRNWPRGLFLISQARRVSWHLRRLVRLPARDAIREFNDRMRRFRLRLHARRDPLAPSVTSLTAASANSSQERCFAAMAAYVPAHFPGKIVVFRAEDEDFACDPARLWRRFADTIEQRTIPGSHLGLVRNTNSVSRLATALDGYLRHV